MDLQSAQKLMQDAIQHLQLEFSKMQVGRANTAMVEGILVEAYGQQQPIRSVASLSTPDVRTIMIQPWDRSILGSVEKSIRVRSDLGLNPVNDGNVLRINIPTPTEERRKELVKVARSKAEDGKISVRNARGKFHSELKELKKTVSEDVVHMQEKDLQKAVDNANAKIDEMVKAKEKEIMTV